MKRPPASDETGGPSVSTATVVPPGRHRDRHACSCGPPHLRRSTDFTVPRPSPGPRQERPTPAGLLAHGSPPRCTAFPGRSRKRVRPSGCPRRTDAGDVQRARRLQLQGQPRLRGNPLTAFPFKPLSGHQRSHETGDPGNRSPRWRTYRNDRARASAHRQRSKRRSASGSRACQSRRSSSGMSEGASGVPRHSRATNDQVAGTSSSAVTASALRIDTQPRP